MSDLEKFKELYASIGVDYQIDTKLDPFSWDRNGIETYIPSGSIVLSLIEGWSAKIVGYTGFYTEIFFTPEGKFICQGIWE